LWFNIRMTNPLDRISIARKYAAAGFAGHDFMLD